MYGHVLEDNSGPAAEIELEEYAEFQRLVSKYPEHEIYLFLGTEVDMALFCAPGILAMLVESRAWPDKIL